jgi:hypothetical protein
MKPKRQEDQGTGGGGEAPVTASPAPAAATSTDDAKKKRDAAADRQRKRRAAEKAEREEKERKKLAKANAPRPEVDAPLTTSQATEEKAPEGWPAPAATAAMLPAALALLTSTRAAIGSTRYGLALEAQTSEVPGPKGKMVKVTVDPVQVLAQPLAAMLAQGGSAPTPGQQFAFGCAMFLGPVAFAHGIELTVSFFDNRKKRREAEEAKAAQKNDEQDARASSKPEPKKNAAPATPAQTSVELKLGDPDGAPKGAAA